MRIVVAGVGGQGVLATARFLAAAAAREGRDAIAGQLHGMAQRGGSVVATVVIGGRSSIVGDGEADVILATEPLEGLRALAKLRPGGLVVMSTRALPPAATVAARAGCPPLADILDAMRARAGALATLDAAAIAAEAGSARAQNVAILGALAGTGRSPVAADALLAAIDEISAPAAAEGRVRDANRRAFALGREAFRILY